LSGFVAISAHEAGVPFLGAGCGCPVRLDDAVGSGAATQ